MKKIFFAVIFTIAMAGVNAQTFGVKAGLNISKYRFTRNTSSQNKNDVIGMAVGGFAKFKIADKLTFQPELLFSIQGSNYTTLGFGTGSGWSKEAADKLSYINLPLIIKYSITDDFNIQFGPQIGFLMTAEEDYTIIDNLTVELGHATIKDSFKDVDFGIDFGVGYEVKNNISLDIRYNLGLSDLTDSIGSGVDNKMFNSVIQFTVGYAFK